MGGADHRPFGPHLLDAAQQELAEASRLFDLSEHRLRSPCRIPATNRETLAGFSPQSAKPKSIAAK